MLTVLEARFMEQMPVILRELTKAIQQDTKAKNELTAAIEEFNRLKTQEKEQ